MWKSILETLKNYIRDKNVTAKTTQATKKRIDQIIKLYTDRKIARVSTAENLIKGLLSTNKRTYDKAFQKFKDNIDKWNGAETLSKRLTEAKKKKQKKTYFVEYLLYWYYKGDLKESGITQKKAFSHLGIHFFRVFDKGVENQPESATITITEEFPKDMIGKRIFRWESIEDFGKGNKQNPEYLRAIELLENDDDFKNQYEAIRYHYDSIGCLKIKSVEMVNDKGEKYNIMDDNLTNADENVSIYHNYIHTPLSLDADTIHKAINKGHYIKNQCWVNCLMDFYSDTLMSDKKRAKNKLTVERISEIIGRDNFAENGASINEMGKVFKEFGIQARIFNFFNQIIYKYDPPKSNHHIKVFYAMVKNSHIYTLNHDLKSIQQKQNLDRPIVKATTDFYINNKENPTYYKMIDNVNDILKLELEDDVKEVYLIMKDNDLTKALFDLTRNGYEPDIQHQPNGITNIKLKFNKIKYTIKTQNLLTDSCDGCITVDTEQIYNAMQFAFFHLHKAVFNPNHKSYYSDIDLKILNESRTIVPCGLFEEVKNIPKDIAELDLSKAFTSKFIEILKIAIFTQFDVWRKFDATTMDIQQMPDLTLYCVKIPDSQFIRYRTRIMFNKECNVVYGKILKTVLKERKIPNFKIIAYKLPSKTEDVDYKSTIEELYKVKISDDPVEDKNLKKLIANVAIGLLEKGGATDKKSLLFKNIAEALDCQSEYGGKLHKIAEQECMEDEKGIYEGEVTRNHYILNIKDTAELVNGFRYIKELLLQQHNFTMYEAYNKLTKNDINVYSAKTDAFVIDSKNVEKAKTVLNFHNDIGGWRVSKYGSDIILPTKMYEVVKNELIDIPTLESKELLIKDEYDTDNIIEVIKENNPVIITADFAGSGKSYICQRMVDKGYKVMFVTPTNKLLQEFEGEAITVNKFFGISFGSTKLKPTDYSEYDVIVFDEIFFSNTSTYWKIKQFVEHNKKDKIIIATGDGKQLRPIQELTNTRDHEEYTNEIIEHIFDYRINLKICKRLHTEEDRAKLHNIKIVIFVNKLSVKEINTFHTLMTYQHHPITLLS